MRFARAGAVGAATLFPSLLAVGLAGCAGGTSQELPVEEQAVHTAGANWRSEALQSELLASLRAMEGCTYR